MIVTYTDHDKRLHVVFDDERTAPPESYNIYLLDMLRGVIAQPGESAAATWNRVLVTVATMRYARCIPHMYFATVFVDVWPNKEQRKRITKERISAKLYELANPAHNKDIDSRVEAFIALSKLHGLNQPEVFVVPTLEQLNEEIASHQGRK